MSEKIIISFDDENPEKPEKAEEKIIIDFKTEPKEKSEKKILSSVVNSHFKGNPQLTRFESNELTYPEGLENGFRKIYSINLRDNFLNSILLNNKFVVLTSTNGVVYFIDRISGGVVNKISITGESFEKTGIIIDNRVYINSLKTIYGFDIAEERVSEKILYNTGDGFYIWSNLNKIPGSIIFLEYSLTNRTARIVKLNIIEGGESGISVEYSPEFNVVSLLYDSAIVSGESIFVFYDDKIFKYIFGKKEVKEYCINFNIKSDTNFLLLDGKIYFNNENNELFYFDIQKEEQRFTGIKCRYINSIGGFNDNLFIGALDGWHLYKTTGVLVHSYEDVNGNTIESINKNILAVSNDKKLIFHNLKKFHEAEGFTLSQGREESETDKVVSVKICEDAIYGLTKSGIMEIFNNDKLNLFI